MRTSKKGFDKKMGRQATKEALFLILIAVGIAISVYAVRTDKVMIISQVKSGDHSDSAPQVSGPTEISMDKAKRLFFDKGALFADARHLEDFEAGHIQGAINLYALDPDAWLADFLATTKPTTVIVTYCSEDCHLANDLAEILFFNGFNQVHHLEDGWEQWQDQGMPIE